MIRILKYTACLGLVALTLTGCRDFSFSSFMRGEALAVVGDKKLYPEDVQTLFMADLSPEDSLKLLNSYVDLWVKQQLKIQEAEKAFPEDEERITRMVEDYRNSLLIYEYEKDYVGSRLDTLITPAEIDDYYTNHADEFRLIVPLVKGVVVRFPVGFRQEGQMRIMATSAKTERLQDLVDIAVKNNFGYREFDDWVEVNEMTAFLPRLGEAEVLRLLAANPLYEFENNGTRYFVVLTDVLPAGAPMPVDRAAATIRTMIVTRRKQELIRNLDDSLYRHALAMKEAVIQIDTLKEIIERQDTITVE